jgi:hypothetical protein
MAKNLSKALGTDLAGLAQLLRSKGRGKDTILAHINPQEAALLKRAGGSGSINPETGLPEFQEDYGNFGGDTPIDYGDLGYDTPVYFDGNPQSPSEVASAYPDLYPGGTIAQAGEVDYLNLPSNLVGSDQDAINEYYAQRNGEYTGDAMGGPATIGPATAFGLGGKEIGVASGFQMTPEGKVQQIPQEQQGALDQIGGTVSGALSRVGKAFGGMDDKTLARLGLTGGLGLIGALNARKAGQQAQAATAEQKAIAQPYTEAGQRLMTQAQAGQLTPQSQASLDAAKARIAQSVASRGGVGQQQSANQVAQIYNNLLDNQFKYGLQVAQIGDNITLGAIRTGLQLDRQMQANTQNFYTQLAQIAAGGNYVLPTTTRG